MIDHRDSYTHILVDYFRQLSWQPVIRQCEDLEGIHINDFAFTVLSPGYGKPKDKIETLRFIDQNRSHPMVGICLGMQLLAIAHGGTVKRAKRPLHGIVSNMIWSTNQNFNSDSRELQIMHYHSWVIDKIPASFQILGLCDRSGDVMGVLNEERRFIAWQFHPESIGSERGLELLERSVHWVMNEE
jgi:anthranilate/para-aminobenzoate synthase component II